MRLSLGWIRTRVARRVLGLFVVGAALPVAVMAVLSFLAVNRQIGAQAEERLEQLAKNAGQSVLQQLLLTEAGLRRVADAVAQGSEALPGPPPTVLESIWDRGGQIRPLWGVPFGPPQTDSAQAAFLARGGTVIVRPGDSAAGMFAALPVDGSDPGSGVVWARLNADSLWSAARTFTSLPTVEEFCVLAGGEPLHCLSGTSALATAWLSERAGGTAGGVAEVSLDGASHVVGYWDLFLQPSFGESTWTMMVAESVESVYAPLDAFAFSFPLSLLVGLLMVVWLAYVQVTRTMGPLQALDSGTRSIASGNFGARVEVRSDDEFGALAGSFNRMAEDLGTQFTQLEAAGAIDRAVLSAQEQDQVVGSVLDQFGSVVPCRSVAVLLHERGGGDAARLRWRTGTRTLGGTSLNLLSEDLTWLRSHQGSGFAQDGQEPPFVRRARVGLGPGPVVVLPFLVKGQIRGAILFERPGNQEIRAGEVERGRQVADQAAVALDEIRLIEELEEMSWGAIRALARAIDAKSKWTAGHSERVTETSLGLARQMGLDDEQLETLHRGGLLHDVGKIGVPARVLDMGGSLSPEDWQLIREHPTIGGQILAPIPALQPALPIVRQHHERWDGQGYPAGLKGHEIDRLARILSVADTFDAMTSPRPYHAPQEPSLALHEIVLHAGSQFDPEPVDAFVAYMARQDIRPEAPKRKIR